MSTILATDTPIPPEKSAQRSELVLKSSEFRKGREASWRDLEVLVERVERRGAGALSLEELQRLPILYRAALSSLSVARSIALDRNLLLYLENLALRAFLCVYGPRVDARAGIAAFFARDLPKAVRAARWHILIAALAVIVGVAAGFLLALQDETWVSTLVPSDLAGGRGPSSTRADLHDKEIFAPWPGFAASFGVFANVLFSHNTAVGLLAFGLGLAVGVPSLMLMVYQGLTLGAFLALHYTRDLTVDFLGWISIHGVTELTAIMLFAGAGLLIAEKLLFPGRYSRIESIAMHGRQAGNIAVGAVIMLFIAAFLEGGCRQLVASTPWRFAIGFATAVFWSGYFGFAGRGSDDARS